MFLGGCSLLGSSVFSMLLPRRPRRRRRRRSPSGVWRKSSSMYNLRENSYLTDSFLPCRVLFPVHPQRQVSREEGEERGGEEAEAAAVAGLVVAFWVEKWVFRTWVHIWAGLLPFKKLIAFKRSAFKIAGLRSEFNVQNLTAFKRSK